MRGTWALVAGLLVLVACGPTPEASAKSSPVSPSTTQSSPAVTPNPMALGQHDCTAPPATAGTMVHSPALSATVTLPIGWSENPADEGQQGLQAAFDVTSTRGPNGINIAGQLLPSTMTMSPHDAAELMSSQPRAGTVIAKGDCTIAGGKAAFFLSAISAIGAGYSLVIAHGQALVYVIVLLPAVNDPGMSDVKRILGSWQWDPS